MLVTHEKAKGIVTTFVSLDHIEPRDKGLALVTILYLSENKLEDLCCYLGSKTQEVKVQKALFIRGPGLRLLLFC